jgi:PAS domain-containing protein
MLQFYEEMGVSLEIGKNLLEEIPSDDYRKNRWEYERVLAGEKFVVTREIEINTRKFFFELNYNPILNERQRVIGASIFMENITQQIQAENQLKEAQANLTSLINDTEDMIMALDKNYRLIVANEVCLEEFAKNGYTLQIGASFLDYFPDNTRFNWKSLYDRALNGERFAKVIETGKTPDKTYREYWFNPILDEKDQITGLSIFSRDITEAKTAENKIRQVLLESLESAENLKIREAEMQQKIMEYELKIRELEEKISVT